MLLTRLMFAVALLALALLIGCGGSSNSAHVQGVVTINGQPLPADAIGSVTFQTTKAGQGRTVSAPIEGGKYNSPETPLGPVRIFITVQQPTGKTIDNGRGTPAPEYKSLASDEHASGFDKEIEGDTEDFNFDLKGM
jgi:hypothetical protein